MTLPVRNKPSFLKLHLPILQRPFFHVADAGGGEFVDDELGVVQVFETGAEEGLVFQISSSMVRSVRISAVAVMRTWLWSSSV